MTRVLAISSSPKSGQSNSKDLIDAFIDDWSQMDPSLHVTYRDIGAQPPAHLDGATIDAFYTSPDDLTPEQENLLRYSDKAIDEIEQADILLIGAPMYNFTIPSNLKAWIDQITRVGKTFVYTDKGPKGLLTSKPVVILGARGGNYSESGNISFLDHQTPILKTSLGFVGLDDLTFIYAEGVASGDNGMDAAKRAVRNFVNSTVASEAA